MIKIRKNMIINQIWHLCPFLKTAPKKVIFHSKVLIKPHDTLLGAWLKHWNSDPFKTSLPLPHTNSLLRSLCELVMLLLSHQSLCRQKCNDHSIKWCLVYLFMGRIKCHYMNQYFRLSPDIIHQSLYVIRFSCMRYDNR